MILNIKPVHPKLGVEWKLPDYAISGSAGMDLVAAIDEPVTLEPGERKLISAGFSMQLELGYEAQIRPRSGLALKYGITVLNSPGTIDAGFLGVLGVILLNTDKYSAFTINPGDRIAQMVISRVEQVEWRVVAELQPTKRGSGGFGSTGK
jgi:dUTP pyrophosphatase